MSAVPEETARFPGVFIHESAYVDSPVEIGQGTKICHFCHILGHVSLGRDCSLGQNVMVGPDVRVGDRCKIQNNVSIYKGFDLEDGVFCGPSAVFTNVDNPRAEVERKSEFRKTLVIALANKLARICWAVLAHGTAYQPREACQAG